MAEVWIMKNWMDIMDSWEVRFKIFEMWILVDNDIEVMIFWEKKIVNNWW